MRSVDLCASTGATYRQIDHWTRRGYIGGASAVDTGYGHPREWSPAEVRVVGFMVRLTAAGFTPAAAAALAGKAADGATEVPLGPGLALRVGA